MAADIFKTLVSFPFFIGMGREELENIVAKTKLSFHTMHEGEVIVDTTTRSGMLVMLTDGMAVATTYSDDKAYWVEEEINGPTLVQPEYVFGLAQRFSQLWKAKTVCHLITLDKQEILTRSSSVSTSSTCSPHRCRSGKRSFGVPRQTPRRSLSVASSWCIRYARRAGRSSTSSSLD